MAMRGGPEPTTIQAALALLQVLSGRQPKAAPKAPDMEDFRALLTFAAEQGLSSALAGGLRGLPTAGSRWTALAPFLEAIEAQNAQRNRLVLAMASRIAEGLNESGVNFTMLKGLATMLDDPDARAWRQVSDIDMLVLEPQLTRAADILMADGLRRAEDLAGFDADLHHHYPPLVDDRTGLFVELHTRLMQHRWQDPISPQLLQERSCPVQLDGNTLRIPCPEHRLIHLIAHAQISNWGYVLRRISLRDIVEVARITARHGIDWEEVARAFRGIRADRELYGFLCAAGDLLELPWPYKPSDRRGGEKWARMAAADLFAGRSLDAAPRIAVNYFKILIRDPRRLGLIWRTIRSPGRRSYLWRVTLGRLGASD